MLRSERALRAIQRRMRGWTLLRRIHEWQRGRLVSYRCRLCSVLAETCTECFNGFRACQSPGDKVDKYVFELRPRYLEPGGRHGLNNAPHRVGGIGPVDEEDFIPAFRTVQALHFGKRLKGQKNRARDAGR